MESITIKVHEEMAQQIDALACPNYGTRTEFIRAAIREKIEEEQKKKELIAHFAKYFGKLKPKNKLTDRQVRLIASRQLEKELGLK